MKFENTEVFNFVGALRGMRLPLQSGAKADSHYCTPNECIMCPRSSGKDTNNPFHWEPCCGEDISWTPYRIGNNDMDLAQRLVKASNPHDKFLRQVLVSMDITASLAWWKQMDQYRVGVVTDSQSTMHTLSKFPITMNNFETCDYNGSLLVYDREPYKENFTVDDIWEEIINHCETLRQRYNETKDIRYWKELIRLLPESYLQTRTWTGNYSILRNIIRQRSGHKMVEWQIFINHCKQMPYAKELLFYKGE